MDLIPIEFDIVPTDPTCALGMRVRLDSNIIYDNPHCTEAYHFCYDVSDKDADHLLEFELYNKLPEHTQVSSTGEITQDALIKIQDIKFDGIDILQITHPLFKYHHDFNGTQPPTVDAFYGPMGCNGVARIEFNTPVYLWLLENM